MTLQSIRIDLPAVILSRRKLRRIAAQGLEQRRGLDLALAVFGGGPGALLGQRLLRHKTRKRPFAIALPLLFVVQTGLAVFSLAAPETALGLIKAGLSALAGT